LGIIRLRSTTTTATSLLSGIEVTEVYPPKRRLN
jgi:hypothetical protein